MIKGWLIDCYPSRSVEGMTFWIKSESGETVRVEDAKWHANIYAAGSAADDRDFVFSKIRHSGLVNSVDVVQKRRTIFDRNRSRVLKLELAKAGAAKKVADMLEDVFHNPATFQLYNVDVTAEQQYFHEKGLFPLCYVHASSEEGKIRWEVHDSVEALDYRTPPLRIHELKIKIASSVPRMDSRLLSIALLPTRQVEEGESSSGEVVGIENTDEGEILSQAMGEIAKFDPDFIVTQNGDPFVLPYLHSKARNHSIDLGKLNRDQAPQSFVSAAGGKTYFSYGRIMYKPSTQRLFGRIHIDEQNTSVYGECGFAGLFEIARLCRIPLQTAARASIGKCLSGLQFYYAHARDLLVPYKPVFSEEVKSFDDLLVADRGGLVFVPLPGVHERVCELDFVSLYPSIIRNRNISAETVNCPCCPDSDNRIEELGMHICKKRLGIVPQSLELPIEKRVAYKKLRDSQTDKRLKRIYNERSGALKWINVTSFGYLSFRHAKFMKIDAHIAVCALDREILLSAMHIAEGRGARVLHGIVDSLWLLKERAKLEDYQSIVEEIQKLTGFRISNEGIYKWIVFLPSKVDPQNQVPNCYFGCFEKDNEIKVRGIEYRRHDAPAYFKACQEKILKELSKCDNQEELRKCARSEGIAIFNEFAKNLERHDVSPLSLLITRRLSKNLSDYSSKRQLSVSAALKLAQRGFELKAGQSVSYVILHNKTAGMNRAAPEELIEAVSYDSERYVELLADCCATILRPFGVDKKILLSRGESLLNWV